MVKLKKNKKEEPIVFQYMLDRMVQFSFSYSLPSKRPESFNISYNVNPLITTNVSSDTVSIRIKLIGEIHGVNNGLPFKEDGIFLDNLFVFKVKDLKNHVVTQEDGTDVFQEKYQPMLLTFVTISISSIRGILYEKLRGTIFHDKILPIIDPNVFFKKIEKNESADSKTRPSKPNP